MDFVVLIAILLVLLGFGVIPVEMEDPFTKMCQNFFSFLSHTQQRGYVIATTQTLSFSIFSFPLLSFLSFLITHSPNLPTPMTKSQFICHAEALTVVYALIIGLVDL